MILPNYTENSMNGTCKQRGSLKEKGDTINAYTENQKVTVEISSIKKEFLEILSHAGHMENDSDSVSHRPPLT